MDLPPHAPWQRRIRGKLREWGRRYLPAECAGSVCAVIGGIATSHAVGLPVFAALGGTVGETFGYYAMMLVTELRWGGTPIGQATLRGVPPAIRNLLLEFGGAECLDSLFIRPAAMYALTLWSGDLVVGLLLGKIVADLAFYVPVVIAYELRRRYREPSA